MGKECVIDPPVESQSSTEHRQATKVIPLKRLALLWGAAAALCILLFREPLKELVFYWHTFSFQETRVVDPADKVKTVKRLEKNIAILKAGLLRNIPKTPYLVINTTENRFFLKKGNVVLREGICSTGSDVLLDAENKKWLFKTPRGMFRIQGKVKDPVWRKPDWAFVEEGLPVPSANSALRFEYGVLGRYALSLGHGYLIHGTLYKRQLGMPVTHGCIRLADDDLEAIFNALNEGSKVFIY